MNFSEYNKKIIDSFCNGNCIYVAEFNDVRSIIRVMSLPLCIFLTFSVLNADESYGTFYMSVAVISLLLVHFGSISYNLECMFSACFMTNTSMLIRGYCTKREFKIIQLQDIESYLPTQSGYGVNNDLEITTKNGEVFYLDKLKNREQLIGVLKSFTSAINLSCSP